MRILAVFGTQGNMDATLPAIREAFPQAELVPFIDPLLAVKHCLSQKTDSVVCDYTLRIMDGIQLIKSLQKQNSEVLPILIEYRDWHKKDARNLGIGYLERPVSAPALRQVYDQTMRSRLEEL
ncbi:MAG: hypothetical protein PHE47_08680 [Oscillospiraceae bacterium]|nr:hypothetical protein [Oscillospiraceae bacterium]